MAYADELANHSYKGNVIVRINGGAYYGRHQPDSGLSVPAAQRILDKFAINPQVISIEDAKTTFGSVTFSLIDKDNIITALFDENLNLFMGQEVEIWLGRITGSFAWADYLQLQTFKISRVAFKGEAFEFTAQEITADFQRAVFNTKALLNADTSAGASSVVASTSIADFPASGRLFFEDEFLTYSAKNDGTKTFTLTGTTANDHSEGAEICNVYQVINDNPIEILLSILQSGGGGTYDLYDEGLSVADAELDITGMEAIRDATFSGEQFSFELFGIDNILEFLEDEILKPCSLRFIATSDNKLGLTVLDTSVFGAATKELTDETIDPKSVAYEVDSNGVRNRIEIHYGYDYTTDKFSRVYVAEDAESIANHGEKDPYIVECKGVPATAGGDAIATDRATRWLARLANATPKIQVSTFFEHSLALIGERVLLTYSLPTETGTRMFSKELEVIKKGVDETKGMVKFDLAFTNYSGLREGFISPTETCITGSAGATVDGDVTARWNEHWVVCFVDSSGVRNATYPDAYEIRNTAVVSGDTRFTFYGLLTSEPGAAVDGYRMQFCDYGEVPTYPNPASGATAATGPQANQLRYGWLSNTAGADYADGSRPYQITF